MIMPAPSVEYALLSPMLIVFGVAVTGVLLEAFVPRRFRYAAQVTLALGGLAAAFVAVILVGKTIPASGRTAVLRSLAIDRPTLLLQGTILLVAAMAVIFIAERRGGANAAAGPARLPPQPRSSPPGWILLPRRRPRCLAAWPSVKRSGPG